MEFKKIERANIPNLLDEISEYCENERFNRENFEKYLESEKKIDSNDKSMFMGLFEGEKCLSLCYLNKDVPEGFVLIAEIQCVVHGYGKPLINKILSLGKNIWWAASPDGGESLKNYYRTFGLKEISFDWVKWVDGPESFFYKASSPENETRIVEFIKSSSEN